MIGAISSGALDAVRAAAAAHPGVEVCGLLLGTDDAVTVAVACANVAADPATRFEVDPAALLAAHRAERGGGARLRGCYHSHPRGSAQPSATDAAMAEANGWLWLIVAGGRVGAWHAVAAGAVHGRFDPVTLDVIET